MNIKEFKVNYEKLLNKEAKSIGNEDTLSYLNRSTKHKIKVYSKTKTNCIRCNGVGYLRISLDAAKTCLCCYGKGFLIEEVQRF